MRQVREFMTTELVTIGSNDGIGTAARLMREHNVGLLPLVDAGRFMGVVTDRDIVIRALAEDRFDCAVGTIASCNDVTVLEPTDDEDRVASLMSNADVRRLPVVEGGSLVGIVSVGDLAVRGDADLAGSVMKNTGPGSDRAADRASARTEAGLTNSAPIAEDYRLQDDTVRDISNAGVQLSPADHPDRAP